MAGTVFLVLLTMTGAVGTGLLGGIPVPRIYDEFAYLLTAETFAEGRLTNPTHPFWRHFETFEVIHNPSYQAKYPPAQGMFLALGMILGQPVLGVWLSVLLLVGSTAWALRAVLEAEWAFVGALILALQLGISSYWAQSYWGGAVAAAGGALALGGAARMISGRPAWWHGAFGGLGLVLLAASRPLEGLILAVALLSWVSVKTVRPMGKLRFPIRPTVAGLLMTVGGLASIGVYNRAVTGDPLSLPYMVHENTYAKAPFLLFAPARTPDRPTMHDEIERQHRTRGLQRHERLRREGLTKVIIQRGPSLLWSVGGPALLLLLGLPLAWQTAGVKLSTAIVLLLAVTVLLTPAAHPHYFAPAVAPLYLLFGAAAAAIARKLEQRQSILVGIGAIILLLILLRLDRQLQSLMDSHGDWTDEREQFVTDLQRQPGRDLVFVHYPENYGQRIEWVYNSADIDGSEVVWARSIDAAADADLVRYFGSRRVWDVTIGPDGGLRRSVARAALPSSASSR